MITIRVIIDDEQARMYLYSYERNLRVAGEEIPYKMAEFAYNRMRQEVPVRTGFLRESIQKIQTPKGWKVMATAPYAGIVDQGARPHVIFPRRTKYLSWIDAGTGLRVFASMVQHPGFMGRHFVSRTAQATRDYARTTLIPEVISRMKQRAG